MIARITKGGWRCAPTGAVVEVFASGELVHGRVAEWAVADGAAEELRSGPALETKPAAPMEAKRTKKRGKTK